MKPLLRPRRGDFGGAMLQLREGKVMVARALLAVRRADRMAAESFLQSAQRALTLTEIDLGDAASRRGD